MYVVCVGLCVQQNFRVFSVVYILFAKQTQNFSTTFFNFSTKLIPGNAKLVLKIPGNAKLVLDFQIGGKYKLVANTKLSK